MEDIIQVYCRELVILRGVRPATVAAYLKGILGFQKWLGGKDLLSAEREDFLCWREAESTRRKPGGLALQVSAVRGLYSWITETRRLPANPCPPMVVHRRKEAPKVPSTTQFLALRSLVEHDARKSALIELLAGSGLRIDSALALRSDQILLSAPEPAATEWSHLSGQVSGFQPPTKVLDQVRMEADHCKGKYAALVPVTPCAARALRRYLAVIGKREGPVFRWSYASAYRMIREAGKAVGLDIHPHSLRHLFGCVMYHRNLMGKESDVVWVRNAMCHSSIQVTDTYIRMSDSVVNNDFDWHAVVWHWVPPSGKKVAPVGVPSWSEGTTETTTKVQTA